MAACGHRVEPAQRLASRGAQARGSRGVGRHFQCAAAPVFDGQPRLVADVAHERVVHVERTQAEVEQQPAIVPLDKGSEDAGRRLRRAGADRARFEQPHARAATRQFARNGATDNPSPDDDDVLPGHRRIITSVARDSGLGFEILVSSNRPEAGSSRGGGAPREARGGGAPRANQEMLTDRVEPACPTIRLSANPRTANPRPFTASSSPDPSPCRRPDRSSSGSC